MLDVNAVQAGWRAGNVEVRPVLEDGDPSREQAEKNEQARLGEDLLSWRTRFPDVHVVEKTVRGHPPRP
jgi:hypothetical protein